MQAMQLGNGKNEEIITTCREQQDITSFLRRFFLARIGSYGQSATDALQAHQAQRPILGAFSGRKKLPTNLHLCKSQCVKLPNPSFLAGVSRYPAQAAPSSAKAEQGQKLSPLLTLARFLFFPSPSSSPSSLRRRLSLAGECLRMEDTVWRVCVSPCVCSVSV